MRALHVPAAGTPPVLGDLPTPQVTPGHVLVKVKAVGLNPFDNVLASGAMADFVPHEYPLTLGRDAAGVVEAVGEGVEGVKAGDEVLGHMLATPPVQAGTLAEYALLPEATVVAIPAGLDFASAAALPLAAGAAAAAIDHVNPGPGQVVLVNGATGGVGLYAVQLLATRGVIVVATGTDADAQSLIGLGATTVVDYTSGSVADQVKASYPDGVDALINLVGSTPAQIPLDAVRKGGKVATTTMGLDDNVFTAAGLTGTTVYAHPIRETIAPLAALAAAGTLAIHVHTVLPFEQATEGLATLAAGTARGKIVITVSE